MRLVILSFRFCVGFCCPFAPKRRTPESAFLEGSPGMCDESRRRSDDKRNLTTIQNEEPQHKTTLRKNTSGCLTENKSGAARQGPGHIPWKGLSVDEMESVIPFCEVTAALRRGLPCLNPQIHPPKGVSNRLSGTTRSADPKFPVRHNPSSLVKVCKTHEKDVFPCGAGKDPLCRLRRTVDN